MLYNPFSLLNFFSTSRYHNYWFLTGTPTFLVRLLSQRFEYQLEEKEVSDLILDTFVLERPENLDLDSLLLQTGYLTIREMTEDSTFILKHPNPEVKQAFNQFLLSESADDALQQIEDKRYADALQHRNLPIIGIGISFQTAQKGISDHRIKLL